MISKRCPYCSRDSYSSYDDPNWKCPYCGKQIGANMCYIKNSPERKSPGCESHIGNVIDFTSIKDQLHEIRKAKTNAGSTASYRKGKI